MNPQLHDVVDVPGRPWSVTCACDADGGGGDLAFTVGLHDLGLPELLMWARPTEGDDPGADWRLSHRDLAHCLVDLADLALRGQLPAGTVLDVPMDAGLTTVRLAVRPETVGAALGVPGLAGLGDDGEHGLPPERFVVPVGWSLLRPPPAAAPLAPDPVAAARAFGRIVAATDVLRVMVLARGARPGRTPARWSAPPDLTLDPDQHFGPLHALVVARAEQVLTADAAATLRLVEAACALGADAAGEVLGPVPAFAAAAGRPRVPDAVERAAAEVTGLLTGPPGRPTARWRAAWPTQAHRVSPAQRPQLEGVEGFVRHCLLHHVHALLAAEALADVLPPALLAQARRAWLSALDEGDA